MALAPVYPLRRKQLIPSSVLGMMIFVIAELMLFAGFISSFAIVKASAPGGWPPPGQPRLPAEATAINTAALLLSGFALFAAYRAFGRDPVRCGRWLLASLGLGAFFVILQGMEWVRLIAAGLTLTSSTHGSFFYLIVGAHGLHAIAALCGLAWVWWKYGRGELTRAQLQTIQVFWYFVVGIWPVLYLQVYL